MLNGGTMKDKRLSKHRISQLSLRILILELCFLSSSFRFVTAISEDILATGKHLAHGAIPTVDEQANSHKHHKVDQLVGLDDMGRQGPVRKNWEGSLSMDFLSEKFVDSSLRLPKYPKETIQFEKKRKRKEPDGKSKHPSVGNTSDNTRRLQRTEFKSPQSQSFADSGTVATPGIKENSQTTHRKTLSRELFTFGVVEETEESKSPTMSPTSNHDVDGSEPEPLTGTAAENEDNPETVTEIYSEDGLDGSDTDVENSSEIEDESRYDNYPAASPIPPPVTPVPIPATATEPPVTPEPSSATPPQALPSEPAADPNLRPPADAATTQPEEIEEGLDTEITTEAPKVTQNPTVAPTPGRVHEPIATEKPSTFVDHTSPSPQVETIETSQPNEPNPEAAALGNNAESSQQAASTAESMAFKEQQDIKELEKEEEEEKAKEEELEEELAQEEREVRRIGGFGVFLAILAMVFTAHQMSENPDGM